MKASAAEKTCTTAEVSKMIGVPARTLARWVREGHLTPESTGKGKQTRLTWRAKDIERARRFHKDGELAERTRRAREMLGDMFGSDSMRAIDRAIHLPVPANSVICAGPGGARAARLDDPMSAVLRRIGGCGVILPQK